MISAIDVLFGKHWRTLCDAVSRLVEKAKVQDDCCTIPETECPPRCVERVVWKFGRGASPSASVIVRNEGLHGRNFTFAATPLAGLQGAQAALTVRPGSAFIEAGKSTEVVLVLERSASLVAGQEYRAEFTFTGSWERCVPIEGQVARDAFERAELAQRDRVSVPHGIKTVHAPATPSISWKIQRGETPCAQVVVRNDGSATRRFRFSASALLGLDADKATLSVSPAAKDLAAGQEAVVELALAQTAQLHPRQTYTAFLVVDGHYEERLPVNCIVDRDPSVVVQVAQGELPTRIRAHHWYEHFQCSVPCAEAIAQHAVDPPDADAERARV